MVVTTEPRRAEGRTVEEEEQPPPSPELSDQPPEVVEDTGQYVLHWLRPLQLSGPSVLNEMMRTCRTWVAPVFDVLNWPESRNQSSVKEHRRILKAIIDRDPDEAAEAALDHVHLSTGLIVSKAKELPSKRQEKEVL